MEIKIDTKEIERTIHGLTKSKDDIQKATVRARKRALIAGRQESIKGVRETYDAKSGKLRAGMKVNASAGTLTTIGSPQPLMDFKVSPSSPQRGMVRASVKKAGGNITYAFIARMPNGHVGVYERIKGSRRIRQLYTVSSAQMAGEPKVLERTFERAKEMYEQRLDHEIKYIMAKWG